MSIGFINPEDTFQGLTMEQILDSSLEDGESDIHHASPESIVAKSQVETDLSQQVDYENNSSPLRNRRENRHRF